MRSTYFNWKRYSSREEAERLTEVCKFSKREQEIYRLFRLGHTIDFIECELNLSHRAFKQITDDMKRRILENS